MTSPSLTGLEHVPLFAGLSAEALELLGNLGQEVAYDSGTTIFEYNAVGETLFIVLEGNIRLSREIAGLGDETLTLLGPGSVFGENALLEGATRSATARASDHCRLFVFERLIFDDLLLMRQDVALEVAWNLVHILCGRLRETNDKVAMLSAAAKR